jgi:hypothetical protein
VVERQFIVASRHCLHLLLMKSRLEGCRVYGDINTVIMA